MNKTSSNKDYVGLLSLVAGLVGTAITIIVSINNASDWKDFALIGSGWTAALMFAIFLWRALKSLEKSYREIGELAERVKILEEKLNRSHEISHYLATMHQPPNATPRAAVAAAVEIKNPEW